MSVEISIWQTRCNACGHVYGDPHYSLEEAEQHDREVRGLCSECLAEREAKD